MSKSIEPKRHIPISAASVVEEPPAAVVVVVVVRSFPVDRN
jgi:hypothetical protein